MENWLSKIDDSKKLTLINILGSHDSAAYNMNSIGSIFSKTQDFDIETQLKIGIRELDLRVVQIKTATANGYDDLICCHGICDCYEDQNILLSKKLTFATVLTKVKEFLVKNPTECVIFHVKSGRNNENTNLIRMTEVFDKYCKDISIKFNKNLTLGEVRGKIVYTTTIEKSVDEKGALSFSTGIIDGSGLTEINKKYVEYEDFKVVAALKVKEVEEFLNLNKMTVKEAEEKEKTTQKIFPFHYNLSCTGEVDEKIPTPKKQADIANKFFDEYNFIKGNYYGWISLDFVSENLIKKFVETNYS